MTLSMKEIREKADNMRTVGNAEELREAVPFLVAAKQRLCEWAATVRTVAKTLDRLGEKCSKYALEHPNCFDAALTVSPIGVRSGDITIDGSVYHFSAGFGEIIRNDGECLTQEFLSGLPSEWTKPSLKLDTTGIERLYGKTEKMVEALEKKGLVRSAKNRWGIKVIAAAADDYSD